MKTVGNQEKNKIKPKDFNTTGPIIIVTFVGTFHTQNVATIMGQ